MRLVEVNVRTNGNNATRVDLQMTLLHMRQTGYSRQIIIL